MKMLVIAAIITSIFIVQLRAHVKLLRAHVKLLRGHANVIACARNSSGILNISPCHLHATVATYLHF